MNAQFIRVDNKAVTDTFRMKDNPFHINDEIDLEYWNTVIDEETDETRSATDGNFQGIFRVVAIRHEVKLDHVINTYYYRGIIKILIEPV